MPIKKKNQKQKKIYKTIKFKFSPRLYTRLRAEATVELRRVSQQIHFLLKQRYRTH